MLDWDVRDGVPMLVWTGPPGVVAAFSSRRGGVSRGHYATLNLSLRVGDEPERVHENRLRLCAAVGADPLHASALHQEHGTRVHEVARTDAGTFLGDAGDDRRGDGLVTGIHGRALVALGADCCTLVVARADGSAVGVCHAGWRGLLGGVVEATVAALGGGATTAAIGPCAGPARYDVGDDVGVPLAARFGADAVREGRADLPRCATRALRDAGVEGAIDDAGACTIGDAATFFSHRRDGSPGGRHGLIAYRLAA